MPENSRIQNRHPLNQLQIEKDIEKINNTSAKKRAQKTRIPLSKDELPNLYILGFSKDEKGKIITNPQDGIVRVPEEILSGMIRAHKTLVNSNNKKSYPEKDV